MTSIQPTPALKSLESVVANPNLSDDELKKAVTDTYANLPPSLEKEGLGELINDRYQLPGDRKPYGIATPEKKKTEQTVRNFLQNEQKTEVKVKGIRNNVAGGVLVSLAKLEKKNTNYEFEIDNAPCTAAYAGLIGKGGSGLVSEIKISYQSHIFSIARKEGKKGADRILQDEVEMMGILSEKKYFPSFYGAFTYKTSAKLQNYILFMEKLKPINPTVFNANMFEDVAEGLKEMHDASIYNNDIKLENIMQANDNTVKFIDFGAATRSRMMDTKDPPTGTVGYLAPERLTAAISDIEVDAGASDMYSTGIAVFEMRYGTKMETLSNGLGGKVSPEFSVKLQNRMAKDMDGKSLDAPDKTAADAYDDLIFRMISKDPTLRPSENELIEALAVIRTQGDEAYKTWTSKQGGKWNEKNSVWNHVPTAGGS